MSVHFTLIIYSWDVYPKCLSEVHQQVYKILLFDSGEHGGGGAPHDGVI